MYNDRDYYRPTGFGGFSVFPPVIKNLLIINGIVYLVANLILANLTVNGIPAEVIITRYFALIPLGGFTMGLTSAGELLVAAFYPWQLITYQFLHGSFTHILFNMLMLWMFGMEIENLWGSRKFLLFYLLCGVGGAVLQLLAQYFLGVPGAPTVGASGAIFGVMVAFAMMFPDRYIFIYFLIPVKAKYLIAFMVIIEFLSAGQASIVAHIVHLGGAIVGFLFIIFDKGNNLSISNFLNSLKKPASTSTQARFRRGQTYKNVEDAEYYEINNSKSGKTEVDQKEIDAILDKISRSGYQNLTDREKKILFEASKKS
ncbi:MAG: rhomboid family intramembrane serine protease [Ignavibacteriales bacterium]|nr:MAG: rhomboid family intramembrane serine protease [Ignavibacteriales bacterium]